MSRWRRLIRGVRSACLSTQRWYDCRGISITFTHTTGGTAPARAIAASTVAAAVPRGEFRVALDRAANRPSTVRDATVFCKNRDRLLDGDITVSFFAGVLNLATALPIACQRAPLGRWRAERGRTRPGAHNSLMLPPSTKTEISAPSQKHELAQPEAEYNG